MNVNTNEWADIGGIYTRAPLEKLVTLTATILPVGKIRFEAYPFPESPYPHFHLLMDRRHFSKDGDQAEVRRKLQELFRMPEFSSDHTVWIAYW